MDIGVAIVPEFAERVAPDAGAGVTILQPQGAAFANLSSTISADALLPTRCKVRRCAWSWADW